MKTDARGNTGPQCETMNSIKPNRRCTAAWSRQASISAPSDRHIKFHRSHHFLLVLLVDETHHGATYPPPCQWLQRLCPQDLQPSWLLQSLQLHPVVHFCRRSIWMYVTTPPRTFLPSNTCPYSCPRPIHVPQLQWHILSSC